MMLLFKILYYNIIKYLTHTKGESLMKEIRVNDLITVASINKKGIVIKEIGERYEIRIGNACFVFHEKDLIPISNK